MVAAQRQDPALTRRSYSYSYLVGDPPSDDEVGAKVVGHVRHVAFQMAEVAISVELPPRCRQRRCWRVRGKIGWVEERQFQLHDRSPLAAPTRRVGRSERR